MVVEYWEVVVVFVVKMFVFFFCFEVVFGVVVFVFVVVGLFGVFCKLLLLLYYMFIV